VTRLVLVMVLAVLPVVAGAATYTNAINDGQWRSISSVFECRLEQSVPFFGEVVFRTRAGEASGFYLRTRSARFQAGEAQLLSKAPVWMPEPSEQTLASVPVKRGNRPLWLGSQQAELMLSELNAGRELKLVKDSWYQAEESQPERLAITGIGFRPEYRTYLDCLTGLLPANFEQVKRTALLFPAGVTDELNKKMIRQIDKMLELVKHDSKIRKFYVDGHTDAFGDRADNLELSKQRAELVNQYLVLRGVPEDWIVLRWHGERYPVASNGSVAGRAKNRRVSVRMERLEEVDVLPLASSQ